MKKFQFRFQTILDIRARELEKAELKVAEAQMELNKATEKLNQLKEKLKNTRQNLKTIISTGEVIDIVLVNNHHNYISSLKRKIFYQHRTIEEKEDILNTKRQEMLKIRQKKMMLEKLKEKDLKAYLNELEHIDRKMIDEIATNRHFQR